MAIMSDFDSSRVRLHESWKTLLLEEFQQPYMQSLRDFLAEQKRQGKTVYPPGPLIFNALNSTPFETVKVVILGQDPYHGAGQAHGLCFSVNPGVAVPRSLQNIFKELQADLGIDRSSHGCLSHWAGQGVLLLNSVLTVEAGKAASHEGQGWEVFTDALIERVNSLRENVVFLLWGSYAQRKGSIIDPSRHLVLKAPHPSPLSASRGFFGCQHFSKTNAYLKAHGQQPIDWALPPPP